MLVRGIPHRILAAAVALSIALPSFGAGQTVPERLDQYMRARANLGQFSGAVLVARGGEILLASGYGYADLELAAPNTGATRFAVASITKQFTALAVAQLRDAGKLSLADSLCHFID